MKKVVVFGGGTGLSCLLSGLKMFPIDVTTVITVSDNGSSTGVLKEELNIPAVGDVIACSDGYQYEIKDVSKWNSSMFASEATAALPSPTCDWSLLPQPDLPEAENRHFTVGGKDYALML